MNLVTGGAGFIGSHLVEALVARGEAVRVLDDLSSGRERNLAAVEGRFEWARGSIVDPAQVARAMRGASDVFHLAACPSVPRSFAEPQFCHAVNATGTLNVVAAAAAAAAAGAKRLVFASTCAVYGDAGDEAAAETRAPRPLSPYAAQKLLGEQYLRCYGDARGVATVSLRFFNVYGARQDPASPYSGVISIFCRRLLAGEPAVLHGDGAQTRDFVHVSDVVDAMLRARDALPGRPGPYNVATGRSRSLLELHAALARLVGGAKAPVHAPAREGDIRRSAADVARARDELGFSARVDLERGLEQTLRFLREEAADPDGGNEGRR